MQKIFAAMGYQVTGTSVVASGDTSAIRAASAVFEPMFKEALLPTPDQFNRARLLRRMQLRRRFEHLLLRQWQKRGAVDCHFESWIAKDTGLSNFPLKGFDQNRIWLAIVALAGDLQAWSGLLAFADDEMRRWEPKRLRMHLYTIPAMIARTARRAVMHMKNTARLAGAIVAGVNRLRALPGSEPG